MSKNLSRPSRARRIGEGVLVGGAVVLVVVLVIAVRLALLALAVWALWFGIADVVNVGPNFWNIFWIVVGGLMILGNLFSNRRSS